MLAGVLFTLLGAILFSGKAVLVKVIYSQHPIDVVSLLALRMLFSLPFYVGMYFYSLKGYRAKISSQKKSAADNKTLMVQTVLTGILGYYVSSWLDFAGLQFISAGMERIILFAYPSFTLLFAALLYKTKIKGYQVAALAASYLGITIAFWGDVMAGQSPDIIKGSLLVLACSITYALYVMLSGRMIPKAGATFFTAVGMLGATVAVWAHYMLAGNSLAALQHLPLKIYGFILIMAIFTTVLPSLLLSLGLRRIGSGNAAIISSIGPLSTILQAYLFLGEKFGWLQGIGTVLVVAGILIIGRKAGK